MNDRMRRRILDWTRDLTVRRGVCTAHRDDFTALLNSLYARKLPPTYFDWQFGDPRVPGEVFLAYRADRVVGVCGFHVLPLGGATRTTAVLVVDLAAAPEEQRMGQVFARFKVEVEDAAAATGAGAMYTFPNARAAPPALRDSGWVQAGQLTTCLGPTRRADGKGRLEVARIIRFDGWVDELMDQFELDHPEVALVRRSVDYLNWRFVANPRYSYDLFQLGEGPRAQGYLVLKCFQDPKSGEAFGDIVDWLWVGNPSGLREMFQFALAHFHGLGIERAAAWLQTNTAADQAGRAEGFSETGQKRDLCVRNLGGQPSPLTDLGTWYVTLSDSDVY